MNKEVYIYELTNKGVKFVIVDREKFTITHKELFQKSFNDQIFSPFQKDKFNVKFSSEVQIILMLKDNFLGYEMIGFYLDGYNIKRKD